MDEAPFPKARNQWIKSPFSKGGHRGIIQRGEKKGSYFCNKERSNVT
jgi:hypothetical protein